MFRITLLSVVLLLTNLAQGQSQIGVGDWRVHLPYSELIDVAWGNGKVFAASPFSAFTYTVSDNSVNRWTKVNGLSDTGISAIAYSGSRDMLIVGYSNGNLDLIAAGVPYNLGDIKRSDFVGDKSIYGIDLYNGFAYLACGFGIVQIDLDSREVKDTYIIGPNGTNIRVNDLAHDDELFYAATTEGIFTAPLNDPFLANFQNWTRNLSIPNFDDDFSEIEVNAEMLVVARSLGTDHESLYSLDGGETWANIPEWENVEVRDCYLGLGELYLASWNRIERFSFTGEYINTLYFIGDFDISPRAVAQDDGANIWIADRVHGLIALPFDSPVFNVKPSGPPYFNSRRLDAYNNSIWVASGGVSQSWVNNFDKKGFYGLVDDEWVSIDAPEGINFIGSVNDIMDVAVDPFNTDHVFFGSFEEGLVEVLNGQVINIYNETNSTIRSSNLHQDERYLIAGLDFDDNGNLWFSNAYTENHLQVRTKGGDFRAFSFSPELSDNLLLGDVMATRQGQVWMILPNYPGLAVFDYNGTINTTSDDRFKILTTEEGEGGLPSTDVWSFEEDLDGEVWLGTVEGIAVFYTPLSIFTDDNYDAQQILIEQEGNIQILLETETVTAIEIDGGNRKWIGTANSGVFLMSEDGLQQISHYTELNSPILSNNITDIAINHSDGEVFFSTQDGIISLRGTATNFDENIEDIVIFPNPVRPDYEGVITIDGLAYKSDVKITDISGNIVFKTESNGGRAVWNGKNQNGERVTTGVYLVFATTLDGSASNVGKIAFVR